jgi:N-acetylglutamate synthase-like GNAT family acetyltransferase
MTRIRGASIGDIEGISLVSSFLGYPPSSIEESRKRLEDILASESDFVWVYEDNGKIMGWLHLFLAIRLASPKFAEIGGLVVDESCRRSGIGGKLVGEAILWSRQNNLSLRVRCNFNREEANKFYRSLGFETKKTQKIHELPSS